MTDTGQKTRIRLSPETPAWALALLASKNDPYKFVTEVLDIAPFGARARPGQPQLEKWQDDALRAIRDGHKRLSVRSGHGVGKGAFLAWIVLWGLSTEAEVKIPVAANSQDQLRDNNWPEISKWHKRLPALLQEASKIEEERIFKTTDPKQAFAVRRTANKSTPEALAGFHAEKIIFLIDEASGIPEIVFETATGALSTEGALLLVFSNPTKRSGFFYRTQTDASLGYYCIHVNCEDVPRAQGHIQDIIKVYGKESNRYRIRVLGEFPTQDDDTVIPIHLIEAAVGRPVNGYDVYPIWGLDVARFGSDASALAKRRGNHLLEPVPEWRNLDGVSLAERVAQEFDKADDDLRPRDICIDIIGVGASAYDHLARVIRLPRVRLHAVNVAEASSAANFNGKLCHRLRDELWWRGREWFEARDCFIPKDEELIAELAAPTYEHTNLQKIIVESKTDTKKRTGMPSPNRADAFLLTFAARETVRNSLIDRHRKAKRDADRTTAMAA